MTAGVLLLAVFFVTPFGFSLAWKRGDLLGVAQRLSLAFAAGLLVFVALIAFVRGGPVLAPIAAALAIFVIAGSLSEVAARVWRGGASLSVGLRRARAACRCRSGAARSRISAPASRCSASPRRASAPRRSRRCASASPLRRSAPMKPSSIRSASAPAPIIDEIVATMTIRSDGADRRRRSSRRGDNSRRARWRRRRRASRRSISARSTSPIGDPERRRNGAGAPLLEAAGDADLARRLL